MTIDDTTIHPLEPIRSTPPGEAAPPRVAAPAPSTPPMPQPAGPGLFIDPRSVSPSALRPRSDRRRDEPTSNGIVIDHVRTDGRLLVHKRAVTPEARVAVEREASVLQQLRHPGVVRIVRSDLNGFHTEFAGRLTLAQFLGDSAATVARVAANLVEVVASLHRAGWAHGDLAPQHCILGPGGTVVLCSFSHATRVDSTSTAPARDLAAAADIVDTLVDDLAEPVDRRERKRRRTLRRAADRLREANSGTADAVLETLRTLVDSTSRPPATASAPTAPRRSSAATAPTRAAALGASTAAALAFAALIAAVRFLGGPLSLPEAPSTSFAVEVAMLILRIAAIAASIYGLALSAATAVAVLTRRADVAEAAARLASPRVRSAILFLAGSGVVVSVFAPRSAPAPTPISHTAAVEDFASGGAPEEVPAVVPPEAAIGGGTLVVRTTQPDIWTVERGDHFWGIAEFVLANHLDREPTDAEIVPYWQTLIDANRDRLVDGNNPDLLHIGQELVIPPVM